MEQTFDPHSIIQGCIIDSAVALAGQQCLGDVSGQIVGPGLPMASL
jgi:hypothetical protein